MSRKFTQHYADPRGILLQSQAGMSFGVFAEGSGAPTNSVAGYSTGCLYVRRDGGAATALYLNVGSETSSSWVIVAGTGVDLSGLVATAAELNRAAQNSTRPVAAGGANLTVTQALHDGKTILLDQATGTAVTLPAMSGSGARYRFVVTVAKSGGSDVITATGAHLFGGVVQNTDTGASGLFGVAMATNAAGSTTITLNGSTTGGRKGDWFEIEDVASNIGIVRGFLNASGTEATPFA